MRLAMIWAVVLVAMLGCGAAFGAGFVDAKEGFSFDPPGDWVRIPQAEVDGWTPVAGAEKIGGFRDAASPHVFCTILKLQAIPNPAGNVGEFRKSLEEPGTEVLDTHWDAKRGAMVAEVRITTLLSVVHYRAYAFTRADATIVIYCYAPDATFGMARDSFETMADTFHFDGAAAEAGGSPSGSPSGPGSTAILAVLGGLVCVGISFVMVVVVGVGIFVMVRKSKKLPVMMMI